jgi:hypothetical protein
LFVIGLAAAARADLVLEQEQSAGSNATHRVTLKLHGNQMRMDDPDSHFSVLMDLDTRNSYTLLTTNKTYIQRFGSEARWEIEEEKKLSGGTNAMDFPAAPAVATGKTERVLGHDTEIYTWTGARGMKQALWVDKSFPDYDAIRTELAKMDKFNDTGLHRNAQPQLSQLPGMVIQNITVFHRHAITNTLVSVKVEPLDASLFTLPADYQLRKPPEKKTDQSATNAPTASRP